jgi:hypothetical protein
VGKDRARYLIVTSEGEEIVIKLDTSSEPSSPETNTGCDCRLPECDPMCIQVLEATDAQPVLSCTSR